MGRRAWFQCGSRVSARRPRYLFFASPKKSTQKKGDPQSATPSRCEGANLRRGGCGVRRGTRFALRAPLGQPRRVSSRSMGASTPMPPRNRPAAGAASRGGEPNIQTAEQPHGPSLRSAWPAQRVALAPARRSRAQRSEAMARVDVRFAGSLLDVPGARRARGGTRVGARVLRDLTHSSCPSGAPQARSEFCGAPRDRAPQVAPQRSEGVADSRVALSLVTFFRRRERKLLARRATPGLRSSHRHVICFQMNSKSGNRYKRFTSNSTS